MTRGVTPLSHGRGPHSKSGANLPGPLRSPGTAFSPASEHARGGQGDARTAVITAGAAAQATAENFPVALRALPARYRRHLMAVYRFARTVDDIGDATLPIMAAAVARSAGGPQRPDEESPREKESAERLRLLDELDDDVTRIYDGGTPQLAAMQELATTVAQCHVPAQPLRDLIQANRQDQLVTRYETFEDLVGYCRLSANPIGCVVLHIFGAASPTREQLSDSICTALQLAEHWQDVAEDFGKGRIYLPQDDLRKFGVTEPDLAAPVTGPRVRALLAYEVARAAALLDEGAPLVGTLRGAARLSVAGYLAGGRAALTAITASGYDVLAVTPHPDKRVTARLAIQAFLRGR